jgi:hypothetical protein
VARQRKTEHSKAVADAEKKIEDIDRHRCHYVSNGVRCKEPGTMTEHVPSPDSPSFKDYDPRRWLCATHYRLRDDPLGSREALADLIAHSPKPPEDWREQMLLERGLGELQTAWRDMNDEQKQILVAETILKAKLFVRDSVVRRTAPLAAGYGRDISAERSRQLEALYRLMTPEQRAEYNRGAA